MKNIGRNLLIAGMFLGLLGCAGTAKKQPTPPPQPKPVVEENNGMNESFDPLTLNDDDITFPAEKVVVTPETPVSTPREQENPLPSANQKVDGFRIQIFSTKNLENANQAKSIAEEQFAEMNLHCYLEFDSPYYKVRVGDFKTREEAERYRDIIRSMGYPNAWIVKTKVYSNPVNSASTPDSEPNPPEN